MSRVGVGSLSSAGVAGASTDVVDEVRTAVAANVENTLELIARIDAAVRRAVAGWPPAPRPDAADLVGRVVELGVVSGAELTRHALALLGGLASLAGRALVPAAPAPPDPARPGPTGRTRASRAEELRRAPSLLR